MRKAISTLIAASLTTSVLSMLPSWTSFAGENKEFNVSTETLTEDIVVGSETVYAGSTAVTVSITNNDGFYSSSTLLDIGSANVIVDDNNTPIISSGDILEDSRIVSVTNESSVVVTSASADETTEDGSMFTFFVQGDASNISVTDITDFSANLGTNNQIMSSRIYYRLGDVYYNGYINSIDASKVLQAVETYHTYFPNYNLTVGIASCDMGFYLPYSPYADIADPNKNNIINEDDADCILQFYSYLMVGYSVDDAYDYLSVTYGNYCGELTCKIVPDTI